MRDRTSVSLDVRKADQEKVEAIIEEHFGGFDDVFEGECISDLVATIEYCFYDVSYADLKIESILQETKIPYDKFWESGCEYPAGEEIFRINADGEPDLKEFSEGMRGMVSLNDVKSALADGTLPAYLAQAEEDASCISWEDQEIILTKLKAKKEKTDG